LDTWTFTFFCIVFGLSYVRYNLLPFDLIFKFEQSGAALYCFSPARQCVSVFGPAPFPTPAIEYGTTLLFYVFDLNLQSLKSFRQMCVLLPKIDGGSQGLCYDTLSSSVFARFAHLKKKINRYILSIRLWQIVAESTKPGHVIARVRATDADAGANAVLSYSLEGDEDKMFSITPETGEVRLEKNRVEPESLSDEVISKENVYHLVVVVSDGGELTFHISLF